jgi:hypothetical protein
VGRAHQTDRVVLRQKEAFERFTCAFKGDEERGEVKRQAQALILITNALPAEAGVPHGNEQAGSISDTNCDEYETSRETRQELFNVFALNISLSVIPVVIC